MAERFGSGVRVRTIAVDPAHHTRIPRYARGKSGVVVESGGRHPLPDVRSQNLPDPPVEAVYAVRFAARDLWGAGDHWVVVDLWESYLEVDG
ncbi:SH3-like domain-containing protein [Fodinicola feengrottensis]|uniref:SH3-like domain-containing protein n=1 Tax=Fodinicola feengrottensis TaxID=435914 RepID=UPI0013CFBC49